MNEAIDPDLQDACDQARIGIRTLESRERSADIARRRAVVAWILRRKGWKLREIAPAMKRTIRQVKRMVRE